MFEAFFEGLFLVFQWPAIGFLMLGVVTGIWIGAIPGLGGIIGLVLLLPFTYGMEPVSAFAMLLGMYAVTSTSDTIASIMLGVPGTAASQATILDGYPLAQKGQAARALGAAFTVSAFGGVFGAFILAVSLPLILPIILSFNSPELFMLGVLGLAMVGSLSGGSILKGLAVACLGILLSTIGFAEADAIPRYDFDLDYLMDNLPMIPVVLGLFAIPEVMELAIRNTSISKIPADQTQGGGMLEGIRDAFRNWWLAIRCAAFGTYVGILPGLGAAIVDWIAYGHVVQSSKDKSQFGKGDIRGVIAPEAANNATKGGALIPTVAFGIPGSLATAILLGALLIQGLKPGPEMLTTHLNVTFSMVWSIIIANIVVAILLMILSRQIAKVSFVPGHLLVPGVILFVFMGAWLGGASLGDWITAFVMGIVGFLMKRSGWPRPPLILALILGSIMENSLQISTQAHQGIGWLTRPIVLIIVAIIGITLLFSSKSVFRPKKKKKTIKEEKKTTGKGIERSPLISLPFSIVLFLLFVWAFFEAQQWPAPVRQFPVAAVVPGACLTLLAIIYDAKGVLQSVQNHGKLRTAWDHISETLLLGRAMIFFGYLLAMIIMMLVIGQKLVIPAFIVIYLIRWGKYSWRIAIGYAIGGWALLVVFYDQILHLFWYQSLLATWLPSILPEWIPRWLII